MGHRNANALKAYEEGAERVAAYIRMRAERDGGFWAHPYLPYTRLLGDFWGAKVAPVEPQRPSATLAAVIPQDRLARMQSMREEVETINSFDREGYRTIDDILAAQDVAQFILRNDDLGTVDIELLAKVSEGHGELDDYYRIYRIGDRKVATRGQDIIDGATIRSHAEGLREEAKSLDEIADLLGEAA